MNSANAPGRSHWRASLLHGVLPFALLNALLSMENRWPTLWPHPVLRLSFELCMAVLVLLAWVAWRGQPGARMPRALAVVTTFWVVARYLDVTVSAVFGRQVNLYWDSRHVLDVLEMGDVARWQIATGALAAGAVPCLLYLVALRCWRSLAVAVAWPRPRPAVTLAGGLLLASFAAQGVGGRDTRWFFSMPVAPIVANQVVTLAGQLLPGEAASRLSASPAFSGNLSALAGADVLLLFAESYGVSTLDDPRQAAALAPQRAQLLRELEAGGRHVVSARVRSPTFAGASWLAHAALLTGVDMHDPGAYEVLLTTRRPTLVQHFKAHGWRTVNWMPGLQKPWPEGSFYGFDRYGDAEHIGYRGPAFGYWRIPDQASLALLHAQELAEAPTDRAPRFIVFPTLASHAPFRPVAPYIADWDRLLRADAYSDAELQKALAEPVSWLQPVPAYLDSLVYTFRWLGDYLGGSAPPRLLTIVIGDHQAMSSVSGAGASWDVPVHIISSDRGLLRRFEALGFTPGLLPTQPALGGMQELTPLLMRAFDLSSTSP